MQHGSGINEGNGYTSSITGISAVYGTGGNGSTYTTDNRGYYINFGSSLGGYYGRGSAARIRENIAGTQGCIIIKFK